MIQSTWKAFFVFSNKEIKGIIALGVILLGSVSIRFLFPNLKPPADNTGIIVGKLFNFDPNNIDSIQAIQLGIPSKQVSNLLHYRAKGGRFRTKADFAKLYGLSTNLYTALVPYIIIGEPAKLRDTYDGSTYPNKSAFPSSNKREWESATWKIDINEATEGEWQSKTNLPNYIIRNILSYKKYKGAFTKPSQLATVYGLTDSLYRGLKGHLIINKKARIMLNANSMNFKDWEQLGIFNEQQIWNILKLRRSTAAGLNWREMVEALDLTQEEAKVLQSKVRFEE
jgi:DNA uptake protein ComE-like DNA-binding protein